MTFGKRNMNNKWPAYRVVGLASGALTTIGFIGLWLSKLIREHQGLTERQFMDTTGGSIATYTLSAFFVIGLLFLFPISIYLQKRTGPPLPGPTVSKWIAWPVKGLLALLLILLVFIIIGVAMDGVLQK
jgi:hypothetical protein